MRVGLKMGLFKAFAGFGKFPIQVQQGNKKIGIFSLEQKKISNLPSLKVSQMHKNCPLASNFGP
jgi:hypothetical protein